MRRFDRTSSTAARSDRGEIMIAIDGRRHNVTEWAKAHPGGVEVLSKFHGRDASRAFCAAGHSPRARAMLDRFAVDPPSPTTAVAPTTALGEGGISRLRRKLFTREDPIGVHKYLGVFCLLHFAFRYFQMLFADPSAGLGTRLGMGPGWASPLCLIPHAALSLSSLIFHTVPRDRVVGKPMIWQEYRVHNIAFGLRSVLSAVLCHLSIRNRHGAPWRRVAVGATCAVVLATQAAADAATRRLRADPAESTTATMPYWEGCSVQTQRRFKTFYAYCQFMATLACLAVMNPAWPLAVLLAIQGASLLMTLVRKGLLSARGYHYGYTFTLAVPYLVGIRSLWYTRRPEFLAMLLAGGALFEARRRGANKYLLWLPVIAGRVAVGDRLLSYDVW